MVVVDVVPPSSILMLSIRIQPFEKKTMVHDNDPHWPVPCRNAFIAAWSLSVWSTRLTQQHFPPKKTGRSECRMKTEWSGSLDHFLGPRADCFPFLFAAWICGIGSHWQWKIIRKWLQSCDVRQVPRSQQGAQLRGGECGIGRPHCHTGSKCVRLSDFFRICFSVFLKKLLKKRKTTWTLC